MAVLTGYFPRLYDKQVGLCDFVKHQEVNIYRFWVAIVYITNLNKIFFQVLIF